MSKLHYSWSAEVESRIVSAIRNGAFPLVAAEVNGIPREVFATWLRRGERTHASPRWRSLRDKIREAVAYARLKAETESLRDDSRTWLKHGPGRELPDAPGWSNAVKPCAADPSEDPRDGALSLDDLINLIPELGKVPLPVREYILTLMNEAKRTRDQREAS